MYIIVNVHPLCGWDNGGLRYIGAVVELAVNPSHGHMGSGSLCACAFRKPGWDNGGHGTSLLYIPTLSMKPSREQDKISPPLELWEPAFLGQLNPLSARSIFDACVVSVLLFGYENWMLTDSMLRQLESFQGVIGHHILQLLT